MASKCPICGETDPAPGSYCLPKLTGNAEPGEPCGWSVESTQRLRAFLAEQSGKYERERAERQAAQDPASRPTPGDANA